MEGRREEDRGQSPGQHNPLEMEGGRSSAVWYEEKAELQKPHEPAFQGGRGGGGKGEGHLAKPSGA